MHPLIRILNDSIPLCEIENEMCTITCETVGSLVSCQKPRPLLLAVIENNGKRVGYYDALQLSSYFRTSKKIEDPNTRLTSIKVHYLWNRASSDSFSEFQVIDLEDENASLEQQKNDETLQIVSDFATALQSPDLITRLEMQIKMALHTLDNKNADANGDVSFLIGLIYHDIKDAFFDLKHIDMQSFKKNLQLLYRRTQEPLLAACLCVDEVYCSSFVHKTIHKILQKSPDNTLALTIKGMIYAKGSRTALKNHEEAKKCLEIALCHQPANERAWINLAECDIKYTIELIKKYIEENPKNAVLITVLGRLMWNGKGDFFPADLACAKEHFLRALTIDPNCTLAHTYLALWLQDEGDKDQDFKDSYRHLRRVLELDPTVSLAHVALGRIYELGSNDVEIDTMRAYEHYQSAIKYDPDSQAHRFLGNLLMYNENGVQANHKYALVHLQKALTLHFCNWKEYLHLGIILYSGLHDVQKDLSKAYKYFQEAIKLAPQNSLAHAYLGCLLFEGSGTVPVNIQEAYFHLKIAVGSGTSLSNAYAYLGEILREGQEDIQKEPKLAEEYLQKAIELDADNSSAHASLGQLYRGGGIGVQQNLKKAFQHFENAAGARPANSRGIIGYLTLLYDEEWSSIFEEDSLQIFYIQILTKVLQEPDCSLFNAYLGEMYRIGIGQSVSKDRLKAYEYYIKALAINPDEVFAHCRLGALLMEDGVGVQRDLLRAYEHFDRAIKLRPESPYAHKQMEILKKLRDGASSS